MTDFGDSLRAARTRRGLSAQEVSDRSGISRMTLHRAEKGDPVVGLGTYLRIMVTLRIENDLALLAQTDELGRKIEAVRGVPHSAVGVRHHPAPVYASASEMSDAQHDREVAQALRVQDMTASAFSKWLRSSWGRLQSQADSLYAGITPQAHDSAPHFKTLQEKNDFDRRREIEFAVQLAAQS